MRRSIVLISCLFLGCGSLYSSARDETVEVVQREQEATPTPPRRVYRPEVGPVSGIPLSQITTYTMRDLERRQGRPPASTIVEYEARPGTSRERIVQAANEALRRTAELYREGFDYNSIASLEYTNPNIDELEVHYELLPDMRHSSELPDLEDYMVLQPSAQSVISIPLPTHYGTLCIEVRGQDVAENAFHHRAFRIRLPPSSLNRVATRYPQIVREGAGMVRANLGCFRF